MLKQLVIIYQMTPCVATAHASKLHDAIDVVLIH